jgi:glycosyltransferase involved in cell wall biosynthesis
MTPRIWIATQLYFPDESATGYFLTRIAEGLAKQGEVGVICGRPQPSCAARDTVNNVNIFRVQGSSRAPSGLASRLANALMVSLNISLKVFAKANAGDSVLVVTNPPTLPYAVLLACMLKGARAVLLVHDLYPDVLVASGVLRAGAVSRGWDRLNRWAHSKFNRIVVLGRDAKELLKHKSDKVSDRIAVVPHWSETDIVQPTDKAGNLLLKTLGLREKFVVQYAGNMGRTHGLESVLELARRFKSQPDIHFLFIGAGAKKNWLVNAVREGCLTNVTILPPRPADEKSDLLNACDVAIIAFVPGMAGISVPSRMYNILAAGKPILALADRKSELGQVIEEEKIGWVLDPEQPEEAARVLSDIMERPAMLLEMGRRARSAAEAKYCLEIAVQAYERVLRG